MNIGIIGCGNISDTYFDSQQIFNNINIIGCSDILQGLADSKAEKYQIKSYSVEGLLKNKNKILYLI